MWNFFKRNRKKKVKKKGRNVAITGDGGISVVGNGNSINVTNDKNRDKKVIEESPDKGKDSEDSWSDF